MVRSRFLLINFIGKRVGDIIRRVLLIVAMLAIVVYPTLADNHTNQTNSSFAGLSWNLTEGSNTNYNNFAINIDLPQVSQQSVNNDTTVCIEKYMEYERLLSIKANDQLSEKIDSSQKLSDCQSKLDLMTQSKDSVQREFDACNELAKGQTNSNLIYTISIAILIMVAFILFLKCVSNRGLR